MTDGIKHKREVVLGNIGQPEDWNDNHEITGHTDQDQFSWLNQRIENRTDYPAAPVVGQIIYRSDLKMLMTYDGSNWIGAVVFTKGTAGAPSEDYDMGALCINYADALLYVRSIFPVPTPDALFYKLDETAGLNVSDSSGNAHTGTASGEHWITGRYAGGYNIAGANLITAPGHADFDFHNNFSFSMWIKRTGAWNDGEVIFERVRDATHYYRLYYSAANGVTFRYLDPNVFETSIALGNFPLNTWVFLSFNCNPVTPVQNIYVNVGAPIQTNHAYANIPFVVGDNLIIGNGLNAHIDEFKMWNVFRAGADMDIDAIVSDTPMWTYAFLYPSSPY